MTRRLGRASPAAWVGAVAGVLGLDVHISFQTIERTNGRITSCSYADIAPWIAAAVCFVCAGRCWFGRTIIGRDPATEALAALVILVLMLLDLLRAILYATHTIGPCS